MLEEIHVRNLGVVEDVSLLLEPGMTAITGETGAGKTLLTEAIRLLTGGRAEPHVVRAGASEAWIEGRFVGPDETVIDLTDNADENNEVEQIITRVIPADGRSRAYVNGKMLPVSGLTQLGDAHVDLHGQNAHQRLLSASAQRQGLDQFGGVDTAPLMAVRKAISDVDHRLSQLGGDAQSRAREVDLIRFQVEELHAAELTNANEDAQLLERERELANAGSHREAAQGVHSILTDESGVAEKLAVAAKSASASPPLSELAARLVAVSTEIDDIASDASALAEHLTDDPQTLASIQERRALLKSLMRKYGSTLDEVIAFRDESVTRLAELSSHDETVAALEAERVELDKRLLRIESDVRKARLAAAPVLSKEVQDQLHELALPNARFEVSVGEAGAGDDVVFLLGPNPGMPLLPIAKAASGGELARTMLALRLALLNSKSTAQDAGSERQPDTLIFDEVDAGIGGEAALAVGRALSALARRTGKTTQVMVVTHLPQVAAFADHQVAVDKQQDKKSTTARVRLLKAEEREVELARMLSGQPDSATGRDHARELLDAASEARRSGETKKSSAKRSRKA